MKIIKLKCSDGVEFTVDENIAKFSNVIKIMLNDIRTEEDDDKEAISLPVIHSNILMKIIQWADYHRDDPSYFDTDKNELKKIDKISSWDAKFLKVNQKMSFEIIKAANYLDVRPLFEIACKNIAAKMKGRSPEEIRKIFNIENDFTPEEEAQLRQENEWCELAAETFI